MHQKDFKWVTFNPGGHSTLFLVGMSGTKRRNEGLKNFFFFFVKVRSKELKFQHFEGLGTEIWAKFRLQSWKFFIFFFFFFFFYEFHL